MINRLYLLSAIIISFLNMGFLGGGLSKKVKRANDLYEEKKYDDALAIYNDAQIDAPEKSEIVFNMADVFYKTEKYNEAMDTYRKAMGKKNKNLEAAAYYNIGNSLFRQGRFQEAIESYKQSLAIDPVDVDTKYNIEFTEKKIKEMQSKADETKQCAKEEQKNRDKEKEQEKRGEGKKEQKEDDGKGSKQNEKMEEEGKLKKQSSALDRKKEEKGKNTLGEEHRKDLKQEEAERFLNAFEENQKNLLPLQKGSDEKSRINLEKDW